MALSFSVGMFKKLGITYCVDGCQNMASCWNFLGEVGNLTLNEMGVISKCLHC